MAEPWETFISGFHNIKGVLLGERHRNLKKLLRNIFLSSVNQQLVIDNLTAITHLERLFYIDVLIYFRKTSLLLETLKYGRENLVGKILKQQWFLKEVSDSVNAEELVDGLLPQMSFSVKIKLLRKVAVISSEDKIDKVFDAVLKRYGLSMAATVIHGCSVQKITDILENYDLNLGIKQLKIIYNKQPKFINIYFTKYKQQLNTKKKFLIYLAHKDPVHFWELQEEHDFIIDSKLGRRTTKKAIDTRKQEIIAQSMKYIKYLRQGILVRVLNKQGLFKQLYRNIFPRDLETLDQGSTICIELIKHYPKRYQYNLYTETFTEVIKKDIWSRNENLDNYFLNVITDINVREKWAELKYKIFNVDEYIQYYSSEKCIAFVKEKMNLSSNSGDRSMLLYYAIKCCALNKDLISLEKVLKYVCLRSRGDESLNQNVLYAIEQHIKSEELTESHWNCLIEILSVLSIEKYISRYNSDLKLKYVEYLYKNNRPEGEINVAIKNYMNTYHWVYPTVYQIRHVQMEKNILMQMVQLLLTSYPTKLEDGPSYFSPWTDCLIKIFSYNERNPNDKIELPNYEKFIQALRNDFESNHVRGIFVEVIRKEICKVNRNQLENEMLAIYWDLFFTSYPHIPVLPWYLAHDPMAVIDNFQKIIDGCLKNMVEETDHKHFRDRKYLCTFRKVLNIFTEIKLYSHLELDAMVVKYVSEKLDENEEKFKTPAIMILSVLSNVENYMNVIKSRNLIPTGFKVDVDNLEVINIFKEQQFFIRGLKNTKEPLEYLPFLIDSFCEGDYVKPSLAPLYSAFYKSPENELKRHLNKLSTHNSISIKKISITLSCHVFDQRMVLQTLKNFEEDQNPSLQKCVFLSCLKCFAHNPIDEIYEKIINFMGSLKENDDEGLLKLSTKDIPKEIKPLYVQHAFTSLENLRKTGKEISDAKFYKRLSAILCMVDSDCLRKLPNDFCKQIIQSYFFTHIKSKQVPEVFSFVVAFLVNDSNQADNFNFVFRLLSEYKSQFWNSSNVKLRDPIYNFFNTMYIDACGKEVKPSFVDLFYSHWNNTFTAFQCFEEYVRINYLQFKKDSRGDLEKLSMKIVLFAEHIQSDFGGLVFSKFAFALAKSLDFEKSQKVDLFVNILKVKTTNLTCILVIELIAIEDDLLYNNEVRLIYHEIESILGSVTDPSVQLYQNLYFKPQYCNSVKYLHFQMQ